MQQPRRFATLFLLAFVLVAALFFFQHKLQRFLDKPHYNTTPWVTGYLPAYRQNTAFMRPDDYAMLSHVAHASLQPQADGTLNEQANAHTHERRQQAVQAAHAAKRPILLVIMGSNSAFNAAIREQVRPQFLRNILSLVDKEGYDGVDIDMEPIVTDVRNSNTDFIRFISELSTALHQRKSPLLGRSPLLTAAVNLNDRYVVAKLVDEFDQINLMTYDMAQPHAGWVTWFDSAVHNGSFIFPGHSHEVPAIADWVNAFLDAGIPRRKLGIGISFDVACWQGGKVSKDQGVTEPRQSWQAAPQYFKRKFADMWQAGLLPNSYEWDKYAQMAWFSVDKPNAADDMFCNFNDNRALAAKVEYVRQQGLGGLIVWELSSDQLANASATQIPPLRQALAESLKRPNPPTQNGK